MLDFPTDADALIFDLDGTLADTMPVHFVAWTEITRAHDLDFPEDRFYAMGGMPSVQILDQLIAEAGFGPETHDSTKLAEDKEAAFARHIHAVRPVEAVVAVARAARNRGVPVGVATGGYRHIAEPTLDQLGIRDWFGCLVTAEDTAEHKPHPAPYLEAARRLGVEPARCVAYEDADLGLRSIEAAGMRAVDIRPCLPTR